jgi:hypothetical protein
MITGVRVAGRNDQVAGTKGSDVRTNGECVGTRYGVICIGSEGNKGKPERVPKPKLGNRTREWLRKAKRVPKPKLGNRTRGTGLNSVARQASLCRA